MKKNLPLIAGITIPVLLILFVAGSIYLPGIFIKPKYNFLYLSGTTYGQPYFVTNGQLNQNTATSTYPQTLYPPSNQPNTPQLFVYDVLQNQSREISFVDAQKLSLDPNIQSPDGFEVISGNGGGGGFPFFSGSNYDYNSRYLVGHNLSKKLNIPAVSNYYENFTFLGWINN